MFTVDIADAGHGEGLTPAVAAAVPEVVEAILGELLPVNRATVRSRTGQCPGRTYQSAQSRRLVRRQATRSSPIHT